MLSANAARLRRSTSSTRFLASLAKFSLIANCCSVFMAMRICLGAVIAPRVLVIENHVIPELFKSRASGCRRGFTRLLSVENFSAARARCSILPLNRRGKAQ